MNNSGLSVMKKYLQNNNYFMKRGDDRKYKHLLLDGGKLFIPDERKEDFLNFYANCLMREEKLYVIETRTSIFKLFLDLILGVLFIQRTAGFIYLFVILIYYFFSLKKDKFL